MLDKLLTWDRETFIYLNSLGIEKYDQFWGIITTISTWIPLFLFLFFLLFYKQPTKKALWRFLWVLLLILFVLLLTAFTKEWVGRLRPSSDNSFNKLIRIVHTSEGFSFFSGHASFAFALTTIFVLFLKNKFKWIWLFFLWPILIAFSRIYVGVHYPIDLISGAFVGTLSAYFFYTLYLKFIKPYSE